MHHVQINDDKEGRHDHGINKLGWEEGGQIHRSTRSNYMGNIFDPQRCCPDK